MSQKEDRRLPPEWREVYGCRTVGELLEEIRDSFRRAIDEAVQDEQAEESEGVHPWSSEDPS